MITLHFLDQISLKIWQRPIPGVQDVHFWFLSEAQKRHLLKLSIVVLTTA